MDLSAAASRRAEFYKYSLRRRRFFYGSAESQPNLSNLLASRMSFGADLPKTHYILHTFPRNFPVDKVEVANESL